MQEVRNRHSFRPGQIVQIVGTPHLATVISEAEALALGSQYGRDTVNMEDVIVRMHDGEVSMWYSGNLVVYEPVPQHPFRFAFVVVAAVVAAWFLFLWIAGFL